MMNFEEMKDVIRKVKLYTYAEMNLWNALEELVEALEDPNGINEMELEQRLEEIWVCASPWMYPNFIDDLDAYMMEHETNCMPEESDDEFFEAHWDEYWDEYDPDKEDVE